MRRHRVGSREVSAGLCGDEPLFSFSVGAPPDALAVTCVHTVRWTYLISDTPSRVGFSNFTQAGLAKVQHTDLFKLEGNEILAFV